MLRDFLNRLLFGPYGVCSVGLALELSDGDVVTIYCNSKIGITDAKG